MAGQIQHASVGTQCSQAEWESTACHLVSGVAGAWFLTSGDIDNTAYAASWSGVAVVAPSKGVVYAVLYGLTSVSGASPSSGAVAALQAVSGLCALSGAVAGLKAVSGSVAAHNHIINTAIANGAWDGDTVSGVVAQLVTGTNILYQKSSGYWDLADADAEVTAGGTLLMATATIASGGGGVLLKKGLIRNDSGFGGSLAIGVSGTYFVGTTPGGILVKASAPSGTGDIVRTVGEGWCADVPRLFWFEPSPVYFEHS